MITGIKNKFEKVYFTTKARYPPKQQNKKWCHVQTGEPYRYCLQRQNNPDQLFTVAIEASTNFHCAVRWICTDAGALPVVLKHFLI